MTALRHAEIMRLCNELRDPTHALSYEQNTVLQLLHAFNTYEAIGRDESVVYVRAELHRALAHMPRQCGKTFIQALFLTACTLSAPMECAVGFLVESEKTASDTMALVRTFLDKEASGAVVQPLPSNSGGPVQMVSFIDSDGRHKSIACYPFDNENEARIAASMYTMWLVDVGTARGSARDGGDVRAAVESAQ